MNEKEAINLAMKQCSKKEYASGEMLKRLLEWELSSEMAQKVLSMLIKEKFIDDSRFCHAFVNDKLKFSKWGKIKISYMLHQKGVAEVIITESLNKIDTEVYEDILKSELTKKAKSLKANNPYEFKGKLIQFATGRGFEYEIASRIAENITNRTAK